MNAGIHLTTPIHLSKASQYLFKRLAKCGANPRIGFEGMPDLTHLSRIISSTNTCIISPKFINERVINTLKTDWREKKISHVEVFCSNSNIPSLLDHLKGTSSTNARKIASILKKENAILLVEPRTHKHSRIRTTALAIENAATPIQGNATAEEIFNHISHGVEVATSQKLSIAEIQAVSEALPKYLRILNENHNSKEAFGIACSLMDQLNPVTQKDQSRVRSIIAEMVTVCNEVFSPSEGSR